jgi:aldose 1-epimerase
LRSAGQFVILTVMHTNHGLSRREAIQLTTLGAAGLLAGALTARGQTAPAIPARDEVELINDKLRVVVSPSDGAGLLAFAVNSNRSWVDLYPNVRNPDFKMRYASWMMIPYSNRIENGTFTFEGRTHTLRNGSNHAIHGDARNRAWTVVERKAESIRLALASKDLPDFNWPWPIEVEAEIALQDDTLVQRLRITNLGTSNMPAGFGWHPYYLRSLTKPGEPVLLQAKFTGVYPDANNDCLPDAAAAGVPEMLDYSVARPVPTDRKYDLCATGFDGKATIAWPESGVKLAYDCSANVKHFVYFNPIERPVWAAEPAANANNGVNLLARDIPTHGVLVVKPGEAVDGQFNTRVTV